MKSRFIWLLFVLFVVVLQRATASINIIPISNSVSYSEGSVDFGEFNISSRLKDNSFSENMLSEFLVKIGCKKGKGIKIRFYNDKSLSAESYLLDISKKSIIIKASDSAGFLYGVQSLIQYLRSSDIHAVKSVVINDSPRYSWRGYMLDESRHFFGKEKVKLILDMMSYYKLNKFHWHLTDESGWRIEIKQYPLLTSIGGKGTWSNPNDKVTFYTQEDIKDIVSYAADRCIEIIPEIDMPGHATAANSAYPYLSGGGTAEHPEFTFNPGKEQVYQFLTNVLREVSDLFPSKYMHIGGDEVSFGIKAWESDKDVQALLNREGLSKVKDAERYFIHRMTDTINMLNKTLIGWDELLDIDADKSTVIMWWRHDKVSQLTKAMEGGYKTIMCPRRPLYFDFIQREGDKWGRVWNGFCPIEDVYNFPDSGFSAWNLPSEDNIIGMQANLWTERIQNESRLDYMTFPRLCAMAESAWTNKENKDLNSFQKRIEFSYSLFDALGIKYYKPDMKEPIGPVRQTKKEIPMDFRD